MLFFADYAMSVANIGRIELAYGKCHIVEYPARVILVSNYALLIGNRIFCCIDEILCGPHNANDRENTDRNDKLSFPSLSARKMTV